MTVNVAVRDPPLKLAVIVEVELLGTVDVCTRNAALVCPPTIITVSGTCATVGLLLESWTMTPLEGAAVVSVTVAVGCCWPCTDDCDKVTDARPRPDGTGVGEGEGDGEGLGLGTASGELGESPLHPATTVAVITITKIAALRTAQPRGVARRIDPRKGGAES
jgi:hypothetical protein